MTYLPGIVNPGKITMLSLFSLFYPYLLVMNIAFIFFWGLFFKRQVLLSIIVIFIRINYIPLYLQNDKPAAEDTENSIRIMSFNTHLFSLGHQNVHKEHIDSFLEMVGKYTPDIICFQEFTSSTRKEKGEFNTIQALKNCHQFKYYFSLKENKNFVYSNTIVSKYPIIQKGNAFEKYSEKKLPNQRFIYTDLKIGMDTLRVYNVHFSSFHLDEEDKAIYEEIVLQQKFDNTKSLRLFSKLTKTMKKHGEEVDLLIEHIKSSPYKKIVCGDFNDTPASYAYQKLTKLLKDTYREKGKGAGKTYNGRYPGLRIDYILIDQQFSTQNFQILKANISDHYPIFSSLKIIENQ